MHSRIDEPPDPMYLDAVERSRSLVRTLVVKDNLPGLSVAVGAEGRVVWAEGFGWADVDARRPVTPETLFRIGPASIPMTAAAVGLLHERGLLDLDAPVRDYVASFPEKQWSLTTRQLMGHTAGVRRYSDDEDLLYMRRHCETALEGLALFAEDPLLFEPGTRYRYSPYGWTLVGAVVEATAGQSFLDFLYSEVLDPLEMADTLLDHPDAPAANRTSLYWPRAARDPGILGVESAVREGAEITCVRGAGALLSTPTDVVRFGLGMLAGRLLQAETLEMLQTPLELASGESTGHGLGWFVSVVPLGPASEPTIAVGYEGSSAGGTTSFVMIPSHGIVIAAASNVSFARGVAQDHELGGGARPFFADSSLPRALAEAFVRQ